MLTCIHMILPFGQAYEYLCVLKKARSSAADPEILERRGRGGGVKDQPAILEKRGKRTGKKGIFAQKGLFNSFSYKMFQRLLTEGGWQQALLVPPSSPTLLIVHSNTLCKAIYMRYLLSGAQEDFV